MRNKFSKFALTVSFGLALAFIFSCSSDSTDSSDSANNSESYRYCVFFSTEKCLDGPFSTCSQGGTLSNSCPFQYAGTQYYKVVLGNWSTSCPNLNNYPNLQNNVIPATDDNTFVLSCLINSEVYERNTSSQVSDFLATNGLSRYTNDFNLRIAASPYNIAFLIYTNTSNYFRVLIISRII